MTILSEKNENFDEQNLNLYGSGIASHNIGLSSKEMKLNPIEVWSNIINIKPYLRNRLVVTELELSEILGSSYSISTLSKLRLGGKHFIKYIQLNQGYRVIYPIIFICEFISNIKIANKYDWIYWQLKQSDILGNHIIVSQNQLSKLLGVSAGTIINYRNSSCLIPRRKSSYLIKTVSKWLLTTSIKCL